PPAPYSPREILRHVSFLLPFAHANVAAHTAAGLRARRNCRVGVECDGDHQRCAPAGKRVRIVLPHRPGCMVWWQLVSKREFESAGGRCPIRSAGVVHAVHGVSALDIGERDCQCMGGVAYWASAPSAVAAARDRDGFADWLTGDAANGPTVRPALCAR